MPVPKFIAQLLIVGGTYLFRAFLEAYKQALYNAHVRGTAAGAAGQVFREEGKMSVEEACNILGVSRSDSRENILKRYEFLQTVNDPSRGGSPYLQSKIRGAKEILEEELKKRDKSV
ncbi:Mitochondrial import inner membrane translocase subunit tim16 [Galdieria sulphuraria]|uniref:Mitochondrial import inner membrane translocase subunit TIM16 n=1 Tax=Galdieria sulphuraria TaxID=130081 RepID=M2VZB4_GALSU|nr:uncharacterized protein Gasu_38790 [Galdieria sulphuraria]EME28671.1 hypothetical protein Gasu_38790 [Galdieria sulphuraria]GJD10696.1 Mitochondrial import inner membrane translocase subunit tim16 [Galdieria sulphuraria]|eukprot:XP_005705191.1 hypothetical protein Gasu_38790 [Galdieria sulphuraria]